MKFKRSIFRVFAGILDLLGVWQSLLLLEQLLGRRRQIVAVCYHYVRANDEWQPALSQLQQGIPLPVFERQIRQLRRWYQPVDVEELEQLLDGNGGPSSDRLLVTFDDAYDCSHTVAGPCLQRYGVPALVFVATEFVDSPRRFWWARLDDIVSCISAEGWQQAANSLEGSTNVRELMSDETINSWEDRRRVRRELGKVLDGLPATGRETVLDHLEAFVTKSEQTSLPLLTWADMREMSVDGFRFGAHTHTHPRLSKLSISEVRQEFAENSQILERELGNRPRSLAYPFGDYSNSVVAEVSAEGVRLAFTLKPGTILPGKTPPHELPRIQLNCRGKGEIAATIVVLKLTKYFPHLMCRAMARLIG